MMGGWLRGYLVGLADGVSAGFQSQCIWLDCFGTNLMEDWLRVYLAGLADCLSARFKSQCT